jgi:hypothetical protein
MLPHGYELPAALLIVLGGALACFAGYRLFRVVLALYGFIFGALIASSMMGITNTVGMVVAALLGGIAGALILVFAYYVGIALVGAGLGALVTHLAWNAVSPSSDPPAVAVILVAIVGAVAAMLLQRYVIIVGTAFGGAWTLIVGALAVMGDRAAVRAAAAVGNVSAGAAWILYPLSPAPGEHWVPAAWLALGVVGTVVQLMLTGRKR